MADKKMVIAYDFEGNSHAVGIDSLAWRPGAYGIVIRDEAVLLVKQTNGYDLPGGGVELGETLEEAVIREVKEETGVIVAHPLIVGVKTGFYIPFQQSKDSAKQAVQSYFACEYKGGELSSDGFDDNELIFSIKSEWVPLRNLNSLRIGTNLDFRPLIKQVANT